MEKHNFTTNYVRVQVIDKVDENLNRKVMPSRRYLHTDGNEFFVAYNKEYRVCKPCGKDMVATATKAKSIDETDHSSEEGSRGTRLPTLTSNS